MYPVLLPEKGNNESNAYSIGRNLGIDAASLKGLVPAYEVGNELDLMCLKDINSDGVLPEEYDNAKFSIARGLVIGMIDGIRSIDTVTPIVLGGITWFRYGFNDMLIQGRGPDGSTGHRIPEFEAIGYHWYEGEIEDAIGNDGVHHNVLSHAKGWGKPLWITEFGVDSTPTSTEPQMSSRITSLMDKWYTRASTYNIVHVAFYDLYDDTNLGGNGFFGLVAKDGVTKKPRYSQVKSFIESHPI